MPKKLFDYKNYSSDIWYAEELKGWCIVKEGTEYTIKKGTWDKVTDTIVFGGKIYKKYQRLGDAKVGLENFCKEKVQSLLKQQELFAELQKEHQELKQESDILDYDKLDADVARLKKKWGIK